MLKLNSDPTRKRADRLLEAMDMLGQGSVVYQPHPSKPNTQSAWYFVPDKGEPVFLGYTYYTAIHAAHERRE